MAITDKELSELIKAKGITGAAKTLGIDVRNVHRRRRKIEGQSGIPIESPFLPGGIVRNQENCPATSFHEVENGVVLAGSDLHIWPGSQSVAVRAFIRMVKELKPKAVVLNGDILDFSRISKYPPIGWDKTPTVQAEIEAAQDTLHEIEQACGRGVPKVWPLGNHDLRFETFLATHAPEYAKVAGIHLSDHFPAWKKCWNAFINDDTEIRHRGKGGENAPKNNALHYGVSVITGHLHAQNIFALTDRRGTRWGVDLGCMADVHHPAFIDYTEAGNKNWRAGYGVLTYRHGVLLPPELVTVWNPNHVVFRGQVIRV